MPVCFKLVNKSTGVPEPLTTVDERIARIVFDEEPDEWVWCKNWYNIIGLALACGASWKDVVYDIAENTDLVKIARFLEREYEVESWRAAKQ